MSVPHCQLFLCALYCISVGLAAWQTSFAVLHFMDSSRGVTTFLTVGTKATSLVCPSGYSLGH